MINHFESIKFLYGESSYVQIPNGIFKDLSQSIKDKKGGTNIQQSSFAYAYLVCLSFLYKYAHYVDVNNESYIQSNDIKRILGYSAKTKSIDYIIKKDGLLENIGLIETTEDFPVYTTYSTDKYNGIDIREFITVNDLKHGSDDILFKKIKSIVKNKNYAIKIPKFIFDYKGDVGTLYDYSNTHMINIKEFIGIIYDNKFDNIDFMLYAFFKSKCQNLNNNTKSIPLLRIISEIGMSKDSFYTHLKFIESKGLIKIAHKDWVMDSEMDNYEANDYKFIGL